MRIGSYEIVREIGRGGMGVVYEARDLAGRRLAIKVLLKPSPSHMARFERERRLLGTFSEEDGIVPLVDAGSSHDGAPWVVMPYVEGGTLGDRLKNGPLDLDAVIDLGIALGHAAGRCHAKGIVHRDLKPANVLFTGDGRALIADLGLAKHFRTDLTGGAESKALSRTGELRGTIGYAAPEQLADAKDASAAADVFSIGAILYECLTGRAPFEGDTFLQVVNKVRQGKYDSVETIRPEVPAWLVAVVDRALLPDPEARPADGTQLAELLEDGPTALPRRRVLPFIAIGLVVMALIALAVVRARTGPVTPPVVAPPPPANDELSQTLARALERVAKGDLTGALDLASRAVDRNPNSARARAVRGRVLLERLEYSRARDDLTRAVELDPKLASAWGDRACAIVAHVSSSSAAVADAERAIALDPKDPDSWSARATARATSDPLAARADARKALTLAPRDLRAWCALVDSYYCAHELTEAVATCDRALLIDPGHPLALVLRATARTALDRGAAQALLDVDKALERAPRAAFAWRLRALALQIKKERTAALADLRTAVECDPRDPKAWSDLGSALDDSGEGAEAERAITHALELAPDEKRGWQMRARMRVRKGDFEGAEKDAREALARAPNDPDVHSTLGRALFYLNRFDEAAASINAALRIDPSRHDEWRKLGETLMRVGDYRGARKALDQVITMVPDDQMAREYRAEVCIKLGDRGSAIDDLERLLEILPQGARREAIEEHLRKLRAR